VWFQLHLTLSKLPSLSLCFSWLCVSLASLQQVSAAFLQQVSPPASLQQVSLASFYQVYFKKASLRTKEGPSTRMSVPELCRCKMWFPIFVWTNFPENWENSLTWWYSDSRLICTAGRIFVIVAKFLKFEKNMPHAVLMYRPKRRLTKRHHLRIVKLKNQQKTKFVHLNLSGIADVLWLATDGLENANLQHGELIWLDFHHICLNKTFPSGLLQKKFWLGACALKACCSLITSTPDFLWVWHIGWIIWWTLTWPKNATKPYRDYPQWIKPPCLLSLKPPETELYGDQIADSYFSELLCSCYFQRLMSQSYKFTRVNVQTVYSFPALPLLYVWWMLLPKTLRWPKEDKTLLKKLKLLSSLRLLPPHWFTELLRYAIRNPFPYHVDGSMEDCLSFTITDFIPLHYLHSL